jgi:O-antigen ligase
MTLLGRKPVFIVAVAVLFTTLFSFFNLNSYCILLLLACRLFLDGPVTALKIAFNNKFFLAYFAFCLIETAGLLHTHNFATGANAVAKDATLTVIAFAFCAGPFANESEYKRLITVYSLLVFSASFYCLVMAFRLYLLRKDPSVFFYHPLTVPISQNAVFYSVYVLFALQFLLFSKGALQIDFLSAKMRKWCRIFLIVFFMLMIVLLSSKLILVIALLMLVSFFFHYSWANKRALVLSGAAGLCLVIGLAFTDNPVRERFTKMADGDAVTAPQGGFNPGTSFNALQLRALEWRFAIQILRQRHAWIFGVSPGDSQDLLDGKYIAANMYIGNPADGPHRKIRGFIGYNFHNQFIETLVRSGIIGLISLLVIFFLLAGIAWQWKTKEAFFTVLTLVAFFIPQSPLTMQHGVFLFCFFPLLLLYSPKGSTAPSH